MKTSKTQVIGQIFSNSVASTGSSPYCLCVPMNIYEMTEDSSDGNTALLKCTCWAGARAH